MEATGARIIRYGKEDAEFRIWRVSDIHFGNAGCSKSHLQRDIDLIKKDPFSLWTLGGDYCDWITPGDKRFDPECFDSELKISDLSSLAAVLLKKLLAYLVPVEGKCLGASLGNHEHEYMRRQSQADIHTTMCARLGVPNLMYSAWLDIYFVHVPGMKGVQVFNGENDPPKKFTARLRVLVSHGFGAAATAGGKINALKKLIDMAYDADLCIMEHLHEAISKNTVRLTPGDDCREITGRPFMGMISGTYLRGYASGFVSYGEKRGYAPTTLGASKARYVPATGDLIIENKAENVGIRT